jgi:SAM-dependent methyltransferase
MGPVNGPLAPFYGLLTRPVQRARLGALAPWLLEAGSGRLSLLDVGCGLTDLPARIPSYVGCDRDPLVLQEMRRRHPRASIVEWDLAAEDAPASLAGARFDLVLMAAVLEHLPDPAQALGRAARLLAPAGRIVATTPHPLGRLPLEAGARLGLLSHAADEEHETLLSRRALAEAARSAGLEVLFYRRFLFGLNQTVVLGNFPDGRRTAPPAGKSARRCGARKVDP